MSETKHTPESEDEDVREVQALADACEAEARRAGLLDQDDAS